MFYAVAVTTSTGGAIFLSGKAPKGRNRPSGDRRPTGHSAKAFGPPPQGAPRLGPRQKIEGGRCRATAPPRGRQRRRAGRKGIGARQRTTAAGRAATFATHTRKGGGNATACYTLAGLRGNLRVRTATAVPLLGGVGGAPRYGTRANNSGQPQHRKAMRSRTS